MAIYGANKSNSAAQVVRALARDSKPIEVKQRGVKKLEYRGYAIHVHPTLVPGNDPSCFVGLNNEYLAHRLGVAKSKEWVDFDINSKKAKLKCRVRKVVKVVPDCPHCQGSGAGRNSKVCRYCAGTGVKQ